MSDTLPPVIPTTPAGNAINRITKHCNANVIHSSKDLKVIRTQQGTQVEIADIYKHQPTDFLKWKGDWDYTAQYSVNDVVRVHHYKTYVDNLGNTIQVSPGVWRCVCPIPDKNISDNLRSIGATNNTNVLRYTDVRYEPRLPEPTTTSSYHDENNGYWEWISGMPMARTICDENNQPVTAYVDCWVSGSTET